MRFQDKVAVITGAANGIGKATARILAKEGAYLVAVDVNGPALASLAEEVEAGGGNVSTMEVDVLDGQQVETMVDSVVSRLGSIDILVNAVGGSTIISNSSTMVDELTPEEWDSVIRFNTRGTFLCTKAAVQQMKKQGGGKIVNLSSRAGHGGERLQQCLCRSQGGHHGLYQESRQGSGPLRDNLQRHRSRYDLERPHRAQMATKVGSIQAANYRGYTVRACSPTR